MKKRTDIAMIQIIKNVSGYNASDSIVPVNITIFLELVSAEIKYKMISDVTKSIFLYSDLSLNSYLLLYSAYGTELIPMVRSSTSWATRWNPSARGASIVGISSVA